MTECFEPALAQTEGSYCAPSHRGAYKHSYQGPGIRIKDIGRLVFDADGNITFQAGRHDVGGFGNAGPQYCAAVA